MITITLEERELINEIIKRNKICYVGMVDMESKPYTIPMNFGFDAANDILYFHSAQEGHSISSLEKNPDVCITFCSEPSLLYQDVEVACSYRMKSSSVLCRGKVAFEEDYNEKIKALNIIMAQYCDREFVYSEPSVKNVKIWKVQIESFSTKIFGAPHPKSTGYTDQDYTKY